MKHAARVGKTFTFGLVAAWFALSCSSTPSHPAQSGGCTPGEIDCSPPASSGGGGGGGSGDSGTSCQVTGGSAACDSCTASSCCNPITTCNANTDCANLVSCEESCGGSRTCVSACVSKYPDGAALFTNIVDCISSDCSSQCNQSGIGDPCGADYAPCVAGTTCNGDWCTAACERTSSCAGIGTGGDNTIGFANACVLTGASFTCSPGCAGSGANCTAFPGTYCVSTTSIGGTTASVCAALPDASTD